MIVNEYVDAARPGAPIRRREVETLGVALSTYASPALSRTKPAEEGL